MIGLLDPSRRGDLCQDRGEVHPREERRGLASGGLFCGRGRHFHYRSARKVHALTSHHESHESGSTEESTLLTSAEGLAASGLKLQMLQDPESYQAAFTEVLKPAQAPHRVRVLLTPLTSIIALTKFEARASYNQTEMTESEGAQYRKVVSHTFESASSSFRPVGSSTCHICKVCVTLVRQIRGKYQNVSFMASQFERNCSGTTGRRPTYLDMS